MKTFFRLFVFLLLVGGWALAAASLHIVRTPGMIPKLGMLHFVPKTDLTYSETWLDTTKWTSADVDNHAAFKDRLDKAGKLDWIKHVGAATASAK
ncbi:MAG: hypothetical protein ABSH20_07765 [Tepidisphaeraceae bacterium]|jgi:hypothetical protein